MSILNFFSNSQGQMKIFSKSLTITLPVVTSCHFRSIEKKQLKKIQVHPNFDLTSIVSMAIEFQSIRRWKMINTKSFHFVLKQWFCGSFIQEENNQLFVLNFLQRIFLFFIKLFPQKRFWLSVYSIQKYLYCKNSLSLR